MSVSVSGWLIVRRGVYACNVWGCWCFCDVRGWALSGCLSSDILLGGALRLCVASLPLCCCSNDRACATFAGLRYEKHVNM